jgi:hypothetical protein
MSSRTSSSRKTHPQIPSFYRHFFTTIDPLIALFGSYTNLLTPSAGHDLYIPPSVHPYAPQTSILFRILGADLLCFCFLSCVLLRYSRDVGVWRIYEGGILIVDLVILHGLWEMLGQQGRRFVGEGGIRGMDWACAGIVAGVAVVRAAFLLGIGMGEGRGARKTA